MRDLSAQTVIESSVRRLADRVRIQVWIVDARADRNLWAQSYEGDVRDLTRLQREIALGVAHEIRVEVPDRSRDPGRVDPDAHLDYLRGRFQWNKRTPAGLRAARALFERAIERDPTLAPAYAGLADARALLCSFALLPKDEVLPKAKAAALRAVALDEDLAEAHASLGFVLTEEGDRVAAEREFMRAIELNPGYATAYH